MQTGTIPPQLRCDKGAVPLSHSVRAPAPSAGIRLTSVYLRGLRAPRMDIDNFEWWYSEGEAPDEEWDEPASRDVSSDEDETGNDAAVEPDAASDAAEPLTFEQAWAQAEPMRLRPMPRPHSVSRRTCPSRRQRSRSRVTPSTPTARHPSAFSTCPRKAPSACAHTSPRPGS